MPPTAGTVANRGQGSFTTTLALEQTASRERANGGAHQQRSSSLAPQPLGGWTLERALASESGALSDRTSFCCNLAN